MQPRPDSSKPPAPRFNALPAGFSLHWYEVRSVLGQGGFGITYDALDRNLERAVAIKEFFPRNCVVRDGDSYVHATSGDAETFSWGLSRFIQEAKTLARFRHQNIVRVISVFELNGTAYMVMERESGKSLWEASRGRTYSEDELLAVVGPLALGIEGVHAAGFIHRDIKPDNIMVREDRSPVLLDFGSARQAVGEHSQKLTALVSSGYAPVEQYNVSLGGGAQGPWTDIYALGATLYHLICGRKPSDALTRLSAVIDNTSDPCPTAQSLAPAGFSRELLVAIDRALSVRIQDRPQSMGVWRAMLPTVH